LPAGPLTACAPFPLASISTRDSLSPPPPVQPAWLRSYIRQYSSRYVAVPPSTGRIDALGVLPSARCSAPPFTCPVAHCTRIPVELPYPTPAVRAKLPPALSYSK